MKSARLQPSWKRVFHGFAFAALLAAAVGGAPLSTAHAIGSTITVDTLDGGLVDDAGTGDCSLAEAIDNANGDGGGSVRLDCVLGTGDDDIVFSVSGTINLTQGLPIIDDPQNETTFINGDGNITIDGDDSSRIVQVSGYAAFRDFIIQNAEESCCHGGAVYNDGGGNLTIERTLFFGNYSGGNGGAIYNEGSLTVERSTFTSNTAGFGGGAIYNAGGNTVISDSTFYDNEAVSTKGGGVYSQANLTLLSSTFSGNTSASGGAGLNLSAGTISLYNNIFANSTSGVDCEFESGALSGGYNLIETGDCTFTDGVDGIILGEDPRLGSLVSVPAYFLLKADSPAIDSGTVAQQYDSIDQPGNTRSVDTPWVADTGDDNSTGVVIDMGAYEYQINCYVPETMYVDQGATGDQLGTSWADAFTDLQMALYTASNCSNPEEIWVAAGVYKPDAGDPGNPQTTFTMSSDTYVYGGFDGTETMLSERDWLANTTILSGDIDDNDTNVDGNNIAEDYTSVQGSNSYHVVYFDATITPITGGTALDGFVITGGQASSGGLNSEGGGILCLAPGAGDECSPQLAQLLISGNLAAYGGGMFIEAGVSTSTSSATLTDVTFRGNHATGNGGAVFNHSGGVANPSLTNVTFLNNSALQNGGGMVNAGSTGTASPSLQNVTFHSNSAGGNGGGMWNVAYGGVNGIASPVLKNVTFTGNSADKGGGMENQTLDPSSVSSAVLYNVILWGDSATTSGDEIQNDAVALSTVNPSLDHVVVEGGCPAGSSCANLSVADPMLGALADNGGVTETVALEAGSSAIDTGDAGNCVSPDQRAITRPRGADCDIGAFERLPDPAAFTDAYVSDVVLYRGGAWVFHDFTSGLYLPGSSKWTGYPGGACIPAPMDYDGDGTKDFTQLCSGAWNFYDDGGVLVKGIWVGNIAGIKPVPADYDGDGTDDVVVFNAGAWNKYDVTSGAYDSGVWTGNPGGNGVPAPMDYDGDGAADRTILSGGAWHLYYGDGSYNKGIWVGNVAGQLPVPGDYYGDGIDDVMVFRGGAWLPYDFNTGVFLVADSVWTGNPAPPAGGGATKPAPIDYDGDGTLDFTVFAGGPWHFYDDDGTYNKGIWVGKNVLDKPISRRHLP